MFVVSRALLWTPLVVLLAAAQPAALAQANTVAEIQALIARGDLPGALQRAQLATTNNPRDAQARFLQAVVLMDLLRNTEAAALFTQLTQDYPELADPYNNLALLHVRAQQFQQARVALEMALRNDPTHRTARRNLGQVYLLLASQQWEEVLASGPPDEPLRRKLDAVRQLLASPG
jgi:Flp pilus assembly protein TadD